MVEKSKSNRYFIAYVWEFDGENEDITFNENISLRKTSEAEKENYSQYIKKLGDNHGYPESCEYCIIFDLDEDSDIDFLCDAEWQLIKLVEAINLFYSHAFEIIRIDLYINGEFIVDIWEDCNEKYFVEIMIGKIEQKDVQSILNVLKYLLEADTGYNSRNYKKYWWLTAVVYFDRYSESFHTADQLINLITALESLLSGPGETSEIRFRLSHRASMYLYYINKLPPAETSQFMKKIYDQRSKIVHGSVGLEDPDKIKIKVNGEEIDLTSSIYTLREYTRLMLYDAIVNHSDKNKNQFIDYIDLLWTQNSGE